MTREAELLNLLLDVYERSGHCLPGKESNRRVILRMGQGGYADYRENDPSVEEANRAIQALENEGLLSAKWHTGYEGWLYDRVYLKLDMLEQAYAKVNREPLSQSADTLVHIVRQATTKIQTPWKLLFLEQEAERLEKSLRPSRFLPRDATQAKAVLSVLQYTERGPELMRVISANCFCDSKYLERNLLPQLTSITKAYEPDLIAYRALGEKVLTQNVILNQIGILTYPEILEFCGKAFLSFCATILDTQAFLNGFCLQSENLDLLNGINIFHINTLLFVENRTNYRHLVLQGVPEDTLIVYHGGFYSPVKRKLFSLLSGSTNPSINTLFWGDIDLGGFLMFTRLKKELFPNLIPWKMDLKDFEEYKSFGVKRSSAHLDSLRTKMEEEKFDPYFIPVAHAILAEGVTVEQEIMI